MALLEIDQFVVDRDLIKRVRAKDEAARAELKSLLEDQILYLHAFPMSETDVVVLLRELNDLDIAWWVTVHTEPL